MCCALAWWACRVCSSEFITTIGIDYKLKSMDLLGKKVKLQVCNERSRVPVQPPVAAPDSVGGALCLCGAGVGYGGAGAFPHHYTLLLPRLQRHRACVRRHGRKVLQQHHGLGCQYQQGTLSLLCSCAGSGRHSLLPSVCWQRTNDEGIVKILVGNKSDEPHPVRAASLCGCNLVAERTWSAQVVTKEMGLALASKLNMQFFLVSAKKGVNVQEVCCKCVSCACDDKPAHALDGRPRRSHTLQKSVCASWSLPSPIVVQVARVRAQ